MDQNKISIGEAAKISGLTIRSLQHYDNIGVLPASGRTKGGRRYYLATDMIKLEHLVFYRGLGFSLDEIKDKLLDNSLDDDAGILLERQKLMLYNQISHIENSIAAIEVAEELNRSNKQIPWKLLATFMQSLAAVDIGDWVNFEFSSDQLAVFNEHFNSMDEVLDFYNTWKRLSIKAVAFYENGVSFDEPIAQKLADDWLMMVQKATGGIEKHETAYLTVDEQRDLWSPAERELIEKADPFLNGLLAHYMKKIQNSH